MIAAKPDLISSGRSGAAIRGQTGIVSGAGRPPFSNVLNVGAKSVLGCLISFGINSPKIHVAAKALVKLLRGLSHSNDLGCFELHFVPARLRDSNPDRLTRVRFNGGEGTLI